jgi:hypothetical protein
MKYIVVFITTFVVLFTTSVMASPFIVCDPYLTTVTQPTEAILVIDGTEIVEAVQILPDNSVRLHHDIVGLTKGTHSCTLKMRRIKDLDWMESATIPFVLKNGALTDAAGIKLEK